MSGNKFAWGDGDIVIIHIPDPVEPVTEPEAWNMLKDYEGKESKTSIIKRWKEMGLIREE